MKTRCKPRLLAAMIATSLSGLLGTFASVGSYLIEPVRSSCPHWSPSIVVYGTAAGYGVFGALSLILAPYVQRLPPRPFVATSLLLTGIVYASCGATVLACQTTGPWLQGVFLVAYSLISAACVFAILPAYDCAMAWLPARTGLSAGLVAVGGSVGSIPAAQFAIALERLYDRKEIDGGTIFFTCGLVISFMIVIMLILLTHPWKTDGVVTKNENRKKRKWGVMRFKRIWILLLVRLVTLIPPIGLSSREQDLLTAFWRDSNPPLEFLAFSSQILDVVGTIFFSIVADSFGPTRLWVILTGIETVTIGFLPWFMIRNSSGLWGRYAAVVSYSLFNMVKTGPITVLGAISHEFFGLGSATEALGVLHLSFGVAGLVGPVIMENMYQLSHTFESFLYLSDGFFGSGLIILALLHTFYRLPAVRKTEIN